MKSFIKTGQPTVNYERALNRRSAIVVLAVFLSMLLCNTSYAQTWQFNGTVQGLQIYSLKTSGLGIDIVRWKVVNTNSYNVHFKFNKIYTSSTGEERTVMGYIDPKPGATVSGNVFSGDLCLSDSPFDQKIKITKWQMVTISVENSDANSSDVQSQQAVQQAAQQQAQGTPVITGFQLYYVYDGIDFYKHWERPYNDFDQVDLKIVNNNNEKITLEYDANVLYNNQIVKTFPQKHYLAAGETRAGEGTNYAAPREYPSNGLSFSLSNIRVTREKASESTNSSNGQVQQEAQKQAQATQAERQRREDERYREEQRKRDELATRARAQREREQQSAEYQSKLSGTVKDFSTIAMKSKSDEFLGATWRIAFSMGTGFIGLPVIQNVSGSSISSYSASTTGGGIDLDLLLEFWPYYGNYFDVSVFGDADLATGPSMGGTNICYGAHATIGTGYIRIVGEYSMGSRSTSSTYDGAEYGLDASGGGSGSYSFNRQGLGLRVYSSPMTDKRFFWYYEIMALSEVPNLPDANARIVYRASVNSNILGLTFEYSKDYPCAGSATFPLDSGLSDYMKFTIVFNMSAIGNPY